MTLFQGLLPVSARRLPAEFIAGLTLACIAVPEVMGYTKIAGTPVITGIYTMLVPMALYAVFGSSRHLVVGADSATAAILASGLAAMSISDPEHYMALAGLLALMAGGLLLLARFFELGFLANFLSRSVLVGFLSGVGVQVAMSDFAGLFGVETPGGSAPSKFWYFLQNLDRIKLGAVLLTLAILAVIFGVQRIRKNLPGPLIAVCLATFASWLLDFEAAGLLVLGPLPSGFPELGLPDMDLSVDLVIQLLPIAVSMFIVILAQSSATSRAYADRYDERYDADVDLLGLAAANLGAGITGTFVVNARDIWKKAKHIAPR